MNPLAGQEGDFGDQGWSGYPDAQMSGLGGMGNAQTTPFVYAPNLASVGSGSTYWPGDVSADAMALNYLGYLSDTASPTPTVFGGPGMITPSTGTQAGDMQANAGAWDPQFRAAVQAFETASGLTSDGWIGPATRTALAAAVAAANANASPVSPPQPVSPTPPSPDTPPPGLLVLPGNNPTPTPDNGGGAAPASTTNPLVWVGLGVGGLALATVLYFVIAD